MCALPVVTVASAFVRDRHWMLRILLLKGLAVFWASTPESAFLPVRYLLHGALAAQACTQLPALWRIPVTGAVLLELILVQYVIPGMTAHPPAWLETLAASALIAAAGILLHREQNADRRIASLSDRNDKLHSSVLQLTSANTEFLEQAAQAGEESAASERNRITRDLHDVVGQTLTNIIMMMDAALHRKAHEPEETVKLLKWIRKQAQTGLEETRGVLYELRALKPAALRGLKSLKKLVETFARLSRIKTRVEWGNLPWTFDPEQEKAVYHLVQGSLSNAFRHGLATRIDVHFQLDAGVLHVMIRDNGRGGADGSVGLGQRGMEERLARWGGTVNFRGEPFGYVVTAALPLKEAKAGTGQDSHR
jgi:signal transduction histidine kinase